MAVVEAARRGATLRVHRACLMMLAEARGLLEFNSSLLLVATADACAERRRPSGAGAAGVFSPATSRCAPMRRYLKALGYGTHAWNMGRNLGGVSCPRAAALRDLLQAAFMNPPGARSAIVGWSLGGVYARDLALQMPEMVRSVITLGSPFANDITGDQRDAALRERCRVRRSTTIPRSGRQSPATCRCRRPRSIPAPTAS